MSSSIYLEFVLRFVFCPVLFLVFVLVVGFHLVRFFRFLFFYFVFSPCRASYSDCIFRSVVCCICSLVLGVGVVASSDGMCCGSQIGWNALHLACENGHLEVAQWLLTTAGVDASATDIVSPCA